MCDKKCPQCEGDPNVSACETCHNTRVDPQSVEALQKRIAELEETERFYQGTLAKIANLIGIYHPAQLSMLSQSPEETYADVLVRLVEKVLERRNKQIDYLDQKVARLEAGLRALEKGKLYWPAARQPDPKVTMYESLTLNQIEAIVETALQTGEDQ